MIVPTYFTCGIFLTKYPTTTPDKMIRIMLSILKIEIQSLWLPFVLTGLQILDSKPQKYEKISFHFHYVNLTS